MQGFRVQGSGFGVEGFGVWTLLGFGVKGSGLRVQSCDGVRTTKGILSKGSLRLSYYPASFLIVVPLEGPYILLLWN